MLRVCKLLILLMSVVAHAGSAKAAEVRVVVDTGSVLNTMRGGIGASWHAIEKPISAKFDPVFGLSQHGGSGWGGNPPAEDDAAWQQLYRHAAWLGMDFVRVEFEQRMYEPERGKFDWDNPEMRILYRILDWCQEHQADVFLTQMWGNVAWNAFPEFRKTPEGIVHSGPLSTADFAEGLATCVEHLVKRKGYTCIKWLCITNEPGYKWSWWNQPPNDPMPLLPGLEAVRKALDGRNLAIPLSAPDTVGVPDCDPQSFDFHDLVEAYDFHSYGVQLDFDNATRPMAVQHRRLTDWAAWAHTKNRPVLLSELGAKIYDDSHPGPSTFEAGLHNAEMVVRHLNAGVDGFNRWSFNNRGDLDGQFQMIETWDRENKRLLKEILPTPNPYFTYGLLSRFTAKHSQVLSCRVAGGCLEKVPRLFAAALRSPRGNLTLALVNDAPHEWTATIEVVDSKQPLQLSRYCVCETDRDQADLKVEPQRAFTLNPTSATLTDRLPRRSLTVYTTYKLDATAPGVIAE